MVELERIAQMVDDRDAEIWTLAAMPPTAVWSVLPGERELWERPIDYSNRRAGDPALPPELEMVRRNGVLK